MKAFRGGDYGRAIQQWEAILKKGADAKLSRALAETYFRRGCKNSSQQDFEQAVALQPEDACYRYHLGLNALRQGQQAEAIAAFEQVVAADTPFARRAAYPYAVALFEQGEDPEQHAIWSQLSEAQQARFQAASAFKRRPYKVDDEAGPLWAGLAAFDDGRSTDAQTLLEEALTNPTTAPIAHLYLGKLFAQQEDWATAVEHWQQSYQLQWPAQEQLGELMGEAYHRLAETQLEAEGVSKALALAEEAARFKDKNALDELLAFCWDTLAYQAASQQKWATAYKHWLQAEEQSGGHFRLAYNLALTLEKEERFYEAAERWRETLRRRPRRDDHPDAIDDEQIARLWKRSAEAYVRAQEFDEAVQVYKNAVKMQPDNLSLRMELSESLLYNGQFQAATNELQRILDRDPDYLPALLQMGEVLQQSGSWWQASGALRYWERAFKLDPDNHTVRQYLADYYRDQAEQLQHWAGQPVDVLDAYEQALFYTPDDGQLRATLGYTYIWAGQTKKGKELLDEALNLHPQEMAVYFEVAAGWLIANQPDQIETLVARAEKEIDPLPAPFFMVIASICYDYEYDHLGEQLLAKGVALAPPDQPVLVAAGEMLSSFPRAFDLARHYLQLAIEHGQSLGQAYLMLGVLAAKEEDMEQAEVQWQQAEKIAQRTKDTELQDRIEGARAVFSGPFNFFASLAKEMGLPVDWADEDWDDDNWDDDNEYF